MHTRRRALWKLRSRPRRGERFPQIPRSRSGSASDSSTFVVNVTLTDDVEVVAPAGALELPKLTSHPYRLYPVVDQIADEVCATISLYSGRPSSREKDLVDLVVLATTQDIDGTRLRAALEREAAVRSLALPHAFAAPADWGSRYAALAVRVPVCRPFGRIDLATELMCRFIDPVLDHSAAGKIWDHSALSWR
ncbi:nucleotidyl transferase AbiEii/AbiGii toxin family protein [Microbacterium sp. cx-55]|uniref:nucleotidyl transferase AbiEii/AbiGii toxin family protein n=1 Tax=Microbacterium sp. cx-55 TaxID=2875948 RepID=UPI001CBECFEA|nr:nucleotidyl transferase AbiEii/AbiGii toxin family protein [Microbacterium sp. cx-55]MBZ4486853.1 nucleotidyl transferase AbiEii/AbiGii toxin family protein [Microbacterium sp. cx-55]UGB35780.1 nucleotidyl transferase AbiEii/AbiGii toxin family protein [Microbacterium sp. cx-55]